MPANADALRTLAAGLRTRAQEVRDLADTHMNESLTAEWRSASAEAFTARTVSDQAAVYGAAARVDALADLLLTRFPGRGGGYLLAGTVTPETLAEAADQLQERA